ncbi:MAG: HU family DNA-binding protein [Prevotella sp.]|jgi:predicted histone-like DNA-binding protein|nr:HU family DNA-binding protein [Prevotella sp.]MCI1281316.1 HU family DNA-binding protein [Prevotella sp.]
MAIFIKLVKNNIHKSSSYNKWHALVVRNGEIDTDGLADKIQANTTFKKSEVKGLIEELVDEMKLQLQAGKTVNLNGFGRFHLSVESLPVSKAEDFKIQKDITAVKCKFMPAGKRDAQTKTIRQVFAEGTEVKRWKE